MGALLKLFGIVIRDVRQRPNAFAVAGRVEITGRGLQG